MAASAPARGKTASAHSHRRTAPSASEKVTVALPGQFTDVVRWPSGKVQELKDVKGGRHIIVDEDREGADAVETVVPGQTIAP